MCRPRSGYSVPFLVGQAKESRSFVSSDTLHRLNRSWPGSPFRGSSKKSLIPLYFVENTNAHFTSSTRATLERNLKPWSTWRTKVNREMRELSQSIDLVDKQLVHGYQTQSFPNLHINHLQYGSWDCFASVVALSLGIMFRAKILMVPLLGLSWSKGTSKKRSMTLMLPGSFGGRGHFISNQIAATLTFSIICLQKAVSLHWKCE